MKRILFLKLGPFFKPAEIPVKELFAWISKIYEGEIIAVVGDKNLRHCFLENFRLRGLYLPRRIRHFNLSRDLCFAVYSIVVAVFQHYFKKRYNVIIASEPIAAGPLAFIISKLTGAKVVIEVNGNYKSSFEMNSARVNFVTRLKSKYSQIVIPFILNRANGVRLLYPDQISKLKGVRRDRNCFIFGDFVPISQFCEKKGEYSYILFLGYPWFLKGVDVLIKAFNRIYREFPEIVLKIVGYCPDKTEFVKLASGNPRIEFCNPVWYQDAIKLISECSFLVLPSRTEAMGRVLIEAMASRKPVIASNVDGIPTYVKHGDNGLLFESENVEDLALKMKILLTDKNYARQLAENGHRFVFEELSEECYLEKFENMISQITL